MGYAENLPSVAGKEHISGADRLWSERVSPWIKRAWPRDARLIEPGTSKGFAGIAIATDQEFNQAVRTLLPYIGPTRDWTYAVADLSRSEHPDKQPEATLMLIDKLAVSQRPSYSQDLQDVLGRIIEAKPELRHRSSFRRLNKWL